MNTSTLLSINKNLEGINIKLGNLDKLDKLDMLESIKEELSSMRYDTMKRISRFENQMQHIDLGVENTITSNVKEFLKDLATQNNMKFTYRMGKNFIKKLTDPFGNKTITDLDGCYILSNNTSNAKYVDKDPVPAMPKSEMQARLEAELQKKKLEIQKATGDKKRQLEAKIKKIIDSKAKLDNANSKAIIQTLLDEMVTNLEIQDTDKHALPNKRYICIIEAKTYLSENEIKDQELKMEELIRYFKNVYLYHRLDTRLAQWTKDFIETNKNINLDFDGIILILGGTYYIESTLVFLNNQLQNKINASIRTRIEELESLENPNKEVEYELEFLKRLDCKCAVVVSDRVVLGEH